MALDYEHDPKTMDLMSDQGFLSALYHATCVRPGGGALAAPVCSSFVYMPLIPHEEIVSNVYQIPKFPDGYGNILF